MTDQNTLETTLKVVKQFSSSVNEVYEAWTDPVKMKSWMGPGEVSCNNVEIDLKVGGKYRIEMQTSDCENPIAMGEYKEIVPQEKIVFTWTWEGSDMPDTLVSVSFKEKDDGCELTLLHENFPDKETADKHTEGWNGCLASLEAYFK